MLPETNCISFLGLLQQVPQTRWLKATETYCLTIVDAGSLKSGCRQRCIPPQTCRGLFPRLFLASGHLSLWFAWLAAAELQPLLWSSHGDVLLPCPPPPCLWLHRAVFCKDTSHWIRGSLTVKRTLIRTFSVAGLALPWLTC